MPEAPQATYVHVYMCKRHNQPIVQTAEVCVCEWSQEWYKVNEVWGRVPVCMCACVWQQMTVAIFASDQLSAQLQKNASLRPTAYTYAPSILQT